MTSDWLSLTTVVRQIQDASRLITDDMIQTNLRISAGAAIIKTFGEDRVQAVPALINAGALALLSRDRLVSYELRPAVASLVSTTDLHSLPGEPPKLLRRPIILESHDPTRPLFGNTSSLGIYTLEGKYYLMGVCYPDGALVAHWSPVWGERDIEAGLPQEDHSLLIDDVDAHHDWAREAARFAIVLGLLLESEAAPIRAESESRERKGGGKEKGGGWTVKHLWYVDQPKGGSGGGSGGHRLSAESEIVEVRGHIKRQRFGPGNKETKWIYVAGYEARRWVSPKPHKIVVH